MKLHIKTLLGVLAFLFFQPLSINAQDLDSDQLFALARKTAFDQKDYPKAVQLSKQAIARSPEYTDIQVFLGRLYTWMDAVDSARMVFQQLELRQVQDADFHLAYASLEYWEDQEAKALEIVNKGLAYTPKSMELRMLKAKILNSQGQYTSAQDIVKTILEDEPANSEARDLWNRLKNQSGDREIGLSYNFLYFDQQFADNWHILGLSYKQGTKLGSLIFKTNFANKFANNGVQFEVEAYPRLSKLFYMYLGAGYSDNVGIFPNYRTGASLYANLPASFEAEVGFRQLKFSDHVWIYTASVGKYYKNFWFNARTYLTPGDSQISHSYAATVRYYTQGADDYLGFVIGTGISPEENRENLWTETPYKLKTFKTGLDYNFSLKNKNLFNISATYYNVEYRPQTKDNQVDLTVGYKRRF